jgi:hypothetical protein
MTTTIEGINIPDLRRFGWQVVTNASACAPVG